MRRIILLLVKEYQRLKEDENDHLKLDWNLQRTLAKVNYQIHTDAIKKNFKNLYLSYVSMPPGNNSRHS